MATLQGKKIVIIGGSSGIGYGVAKASLLSYANHVIIASSSREKVDVAVQRLLAEPELQRQADVKNRLTGDTVDLRNTQAVQAFCERIGEIDHLIITSGGLSTQFEYRSEDLDKHRGESCSLDFNLVKYATDGLTDVFDDRFWGPATAAQKAKIREGGSIIFTIGTTHRRVFMAI